VTTAAETHTPSRACYLRGCRTDACAQENYRYGKKLATEHVRGERRLHDIAQVRTHIEQLLANEWWQAEIGRVSGVSRSTISLIVLGHLPRTNKRIALAILSIPITPIVRTVDGDRVDATGTIRRLHALAILGHNWTVVGARTGMTPDRLSFIARGKTDVVRPEEAQRIAAAYRDLSTTPGAMKQIVTSARNKGWHGPLAWDDIDDPNCKPEEAKPYKPADKYRRDPDRTREIEHLYLLGESPQQITKKLGGNEKYISDQLNAVIAKRAAKAERERLAAKQQRKQVAA
jgi:transcriptional regulator with XRE-family HTH domain